MLKTKERKVLLELLRDGRKADKAIAKSIGTTQPTVTRIRQKLEKQGYIKGYRCVVDLKSTGISLMIFTLFSWTEFSDDAEVLRVKKQIGSLPEVVCMTRGEGIRGKTTMLISVHNGFDEYEDFLRRIRKKYGTRILDIESFISSVEGVEKLFNPSSAIESLLAEPQAGKAADIRQLLPIKVRR